jgi:coatomer protein complex subunit gamma
MGLGILCEFIEDCEYPNLSASILHILGQHGPSSATPSKFVVVFEHVEPLSVLYLPSFRYLRYIYNRIILETHQVRSAAVAALARFGACVPSLKADVEELLSRCCSDSDDECRDRATFFLLLLQSSDQELISRSVPASRSVFVLFVSRHAQVHHQFFNV